MIERHLTTPELAELLSVNPETLRRLAMRGEMNAIRVGRDYRWPESEVQRWLEKQRVKASTVVALTREDRPSTTRRAS